MMPTPARQSESWDDAVLEQDPDAFLQMTVSELVEAPARGGHMEVDQAHDAPSGPQADFIGR